jgi:hypothetical protein
MDFMDRHNWLTYMSNLCKLLKHSYKGSPFVWSWISPMTQKRVRFWSLAYSMREQLVTGHERSLVRVLTHNFMCSIFFDMPKISDHPWQGIRKVITQPYTKPNQTKPKRNTFDFGSPNLGGLVFQWRRRPFISLQTSHTYFVNTKKLGHQRQGMGCLSEKDSLVSFTIYIYM